MALYDLKPGSVMRTETPLSDPIEKTLFTTSVDLLFDLRLHASFGRHVTFTLRSIPRAAALSPSKWEPKGTGRRIFMKRFLLIAFFQKAVKMFPDA